MSSPDPDRPDEGTDTGDEAATDADPPTDPAGALDELEDRTLDDDLRPSGRVDERSDDGTEPAFDVDLDPEDQGSADAGAEQTG